MTNVHSPQVFAEACERRSVERRVFDWRTVLYGFIRSRRHCHRRSEDGEILFVDRHHPWLFFLAVGTMLLSATDAMLTLRLLEVGFFEANPLMAATMERGTTMFAATKMAMTGVGILMLVYLARTRFLDRVRAGVFLTGLFLFYACVICYEVVNLLGMS